MGSRPTTVAKKNWSVTRADLLAEIGNKAVYLPLITRTHFGNSESILRFVRGTAKHSSPMGAGFNQLGVQLTEMVTSADHPALTTVRF